ncbi:MAG: hypothetical protein JM58_00775 [Peptococcaceae bacterium BICA1-8]|nr:MAG: hypothetical protein JM58_00775 [Peptococcaceae bacterium BICA1-8]
MNRKSFVLILIILLALSLVLSGCGQKEKPADQGTEKVEQKEVEKWPTRPITIIVGFNAGGGMDVMSRAIAPELTKFLGVDVIVQNMPGAGSGTAAEYVLKQPADGYTLFAASSAISTFPAMANSDATYKNLGMLAIPIIAEPAFQVPKDSPYKDMNDLIEAWKKGGTTGANTGVGGLWHIPQLLAVDEVGGEVTYVPYPSGKEAALSVAKGEVDWGTSGALMESGEFFKEGLSRPLAIFNDKPYNVPGYGDIPPITDFIPELKDKIVAGAGWRGLAYKQGIPQERLEKLYEAIEHAFQTESVKKFLSDTGLIPGTYYRAEADKAYELTSRIQSWLLYDLGVSKRSPEEVGVPRP